MFTLRDPDNTIIFGQVQDRDFVLKKILAMKAQVCKQSVKVIDVTHNFSLGITSPGRVT